MSFKNAGFPDFRFTNLGFRTSGDGLFGLVTDKDGNLLTDEDGNYIEVEL